MKNLIKLLPLFLLPIFASNNIKAQADYSSNHEFEKCVSRIKPDSIAPEFVGYMENNPDTIRWYYHTDKVDSRITYQDILLNIDEDPRVDVWERYRTEEIKKEDLFNGNLDSLISKGYVLTEDSTRVRTKYPFQYSFFPGSQDMLYYERVDFNQDGPNGNELSLEEIKECAYADESVLSREEVEEEF